MHWTTRVGVLLCGGLPAAAVAGADSGPGGGNGPGHGQPTTIYRDVVIIGGGASGSYSAVRLREDFNVSVVLVEQDERLGGHVNTFTDPSTGRSFDAGVQNWIDLPGSGVRQFFTRLGVATQPNVRSVLDQVYVDFTTGRKLPNYTPPPNNLRVEALQRYVTAAEQFLPILEPGWWTFPPPSQIPSDLFLPFRDFVKKYNLTAGVPGIFATTGFGMHDMMGGLTLWFMRSFNVNIARVLLGTESSFVPVSRRNQEIYDNILTLLGPSDVLLSSTVVSAQRSASKKGGVTLQVRNSKTGKTTKIVAKKILFTPVPSDQNMAPFDLDKEEKKTLSTFDYSASFVGVISHPSLPLNASILNTPSAAQPANWPAAVPESPYNTRFENYPNSTYFRVIAVGDQTLTEKKAKKLITDALGKMIKAGTLPKTKPAEDAKFHLFMPHGLVSAYASEKALKGGFIQKLQSLQGPKNTWYTGASWGVHLTTNLWVFTDTVLPKLVASL
ncbi:hypothetical protein QBC35DRAFT_67646 [Podospora australis]|uniref:Amine oxidase n=1 Tax=Podospora australis TaxID=1536484 RepID=A0AAN6WL27_9PEZI|nr:hypothetical protein QBC35DRAFT_67646 [Podospora australis]